LQVVPITNQSDGAPLETGEEYDPELHSHCLPGPKLDVEFTDLVQLPSKLWIENVSGHSAVICWSSSKLHWQKLSFIQRTNLLILSRSFIEYKHPTRQL